MQSSCDIVGMVPLPYFDIWGDLTAPDEALSPVRPGQQCEPPTVLSSTFWKVVENQMFAVLVPCLHDS